MKLNSTILAVVLTVCSTSAAWAQDWDLTPAEAPAHEAVSAPMAAEVENRGEERVDNQIEAANQIGFDLSALNGGGGQGNTTQGYKAMPSMRTGNQSLASLPPCTTAQFGYVAGGAPGTLPPTSMDSFVANAGGHAETIYGDEGGADGSNSLPPLSNFDTIDSGIQGQTAAGLTTGHHDSSLPSAWN